VSARLSSPIGELEDHYEVIVVGSGYGGGIAASRLARAGRGVCVLERGKEFQPGEYPDTGPEIAGEFQIDTPQGHLGSRTGLYDLRANDDLDVFVGCGLGGTSLVNANVSLRADARVFDEPVWPAEVAADVGGHLERGYELATAMLRPTPLPGAVDLKKLGALDRSASALDAEDRFYRPPINVTFIDGVNSAGVEQKACTMCGDCVSGCNYAAKNTVLMNYLPDAWNHGARIFTKICVRSLERRDERWVVHYQLLDTGREHFDAAELFLTGDVVVIAAGTLGSTEILLRSRDRGLPLSAQAGKRLSGNGDVLAFGYNCDSQIDGVGWGSRRKGRLGPVGPTITGIIDLRATDDLAEGMVIEEGAAPGGVAPFLPHAMALAAKLVGTDTDRGRTDLVEESKRELDSLVRGAYHGAARNTQTYLVMAHDGSDGEMALEDDRLRTRWPGVGRRQIFQSINRNLLQATAALGGTFLRNPIWSQLFGKDLISVHPLGGCVMAADAAQGVVNHKGQVFSGASGTEVYEDLYVSDGSVIPRSLGVNPLLTISALAERCCALLAEDRGWAIDYARTPEPVRLPSAPKPGIEFTETMRGYVSTEVIDDYEAASEAAEEAGSRFSFTLTIVSDDVDRLIEDPSHAARTVGTVDAPALSPNPISATEGTFNLFVDDPDHLETKLMRYRMRLTTEEGRRYLLAGFKSIHDDRGFDTWPDTTTLYVTLYDGDDEQAQVAGKGILRISPEDFLRQLRTMQVTGSDGARARLVATAKYGKYFAGVLYDTYGGVFAGPSLIDPDAPPRKKRALRVSAPEVHGFQTADGVSLRLTRYHAGDKGPVILSHGLGVSSRIFSIDTIETNMLEFLFAHGYDVWLLDFRASIELPSALTEFSADDVALQDYPAAVAEVRRLTGADSVQMVAHCYGSTTFAMAMLAGLQGVRAAVCSQIGPHVVAPRLTRLKSGLHMPDLLDAVGIDSLTTEAETGERWWERLYDRALEVYPTQGEEHCTSAVCHRITFMYALLYEHDQLNPATHEALHEMFGVANVRSFEHLAAMVRAGKVVRFDGEDSYVPHLERMAIPITFIHGAENACFLPKSTELTFEALRERNPGVPYQRHVIPNYGHIDCIFGKSASRDVYPLILRQLEATPRA
jgi:cholesterol oxidase